VGGSAVTTPKAPVGLQARGKRMWTESLQAWSLTPAHLVLLEEACRTADRLELLDKLIRAATKAPRKRLRDSADEPDEPDETVTIAGLMAEGRAQQTVLKNLLTELRQGTRLADGGTGADSGGSTAGGSGVADITRRIAERRGKAQS
jgi:hypothetical protein